MYLNKIFMWNINKKKCLKLINDNLHLIFFLNDTNILSKQYLFINLNKIIKLNSGFKLKRNNRNRNINNYIKIVYGNWDNFLKTQTNYYSVTDNNIILNFMDPII